jgi:hypothetical protein
MEYALSIHIILWENGHVHGFMEHSLRDVSSRQVTPRSLPSFILLEGSLPCSQESVTRSCTELGDSSPHAQTLFQIYFNTIFSSVLEFSTKPLSFWFSVWNNAHISCVCVLSTLYFMIVILFSAVCQLWNSGWNIFHPPVTSSYIQIFKIKVTLRLTATQRVLVSSPFWFS